MRKFTIDKHDRLFITEKYITTGHWLVSREIFKQKKVLPALLKVKDMRLGAYQFGEWISENVPNCEAVIPKLDGYFDLVKTPIGASFEKMEVVSFLFQGTNDRGETIKIAVNPNYTPLFDYGVCKMKGKDMPIVVVNGETIVAVIMPRRF